MAAVWSLLRSLLICLFLLGPGLCRKDMWEYTDEDLDRLEKQWEIEDDNKPDENQGLPQSIFSDSLKSDGSVDPEKLLKLSKKNKPVMMFVKLRGPISRQDTERISQRWSHSLQNGHILVQTYIVSDDKILFYVQEGSQAWDVKDFLVEQDECIDVELEQKAYPCKQRHVDSRPENERTEL